MAVCKAMGARRIIAIDVSQGRLDFAKQYAATDIHLASPMEEGEERGAYSKRHVGVCLAASFKQCRHVTNT